MSPGGCERDKAQLIHPHQVQFESRSSLTNSSTPNPHWEPRHRVTGYWFAPSPETWQPPDDLLDFLETGDPPVVVSLGAMSTGKVKDDLITSFISAFLQTGTRAVFQGWDQALQDRSLPETIFHAGPVPHEWLLGQARGIIHHGGFGTTAAGFRAGIPSLAVPHIIDQFLWGAKIAELGVGPEPIPVGKINSTNLAEALESFRSNQEMVGSAEKLGEKIRAEDGAGTAVALIQKFVDPV